MTGGEYVIIAIVTGLATGLIGRARGSPFFIWFVIGVVVFTFAPC